MGLEWVETPWDGLGALGLSGAAEGEEEGGGGRWASKGDSIIEGTSGCRGSGEGAQPGMDAVRPKFGGYEGRDGG